jgi:hypothetical protein
MTLGMKKQLSFFVIAGAALLLCGGCKDREPEATVREMEGVIEAIDVDNKTVKVRFYNEKRKTEMSVAVNVTDETEILINGALAQMTDVKEGERAHGTIRVKQVDDDFELTALRVEIKRAEPLKPTSDPPAAAE